MPNRILLASHGSEGAAVAEQAAIAQSQYGDELNHLYVVPSWWRHITGDDWLNNGASRNRFSNYVEEQLWQECQQNMQRIQRKCKQKGVKYKLLLRIGRSDQLLQEVAAHTDYCAIYIGSRRPKNCTGLHDTMLTTVVKKQLQSKLRISSHPYERDIT